MKGETIAGGLGAATEKSKKKDGNDYFKKVQANVRREEEQKRELEARSKDAKEDGVEEDAGEEEEEEAVPEYKELSEDEDEPLHTAEDVISLQNRPAMSMFKSIFDADSGDEQ